MEKGLFFGANCLLVSREGPVEIPDRLISLIFGYFVWGERRDFQKEQKDYTVHLTTSAAPESHWLRGSVDLVPTITTTWPLCSQLKATVSLWCIRGDNGFCCLSSQKHEQLHERLHHGIWQLLVADVAKLWFSKTSHPKHWALNSAKTVQQQGLALIWLTWACDALQREHTMICSRRKLKHVTF